MIESAYPIKGQWYKDNIGRLMQAVAFDEENDAIECEVTEFDLDSWNQLDIGPIEPPEDWSGPFNDLVPDDMGSTEKPKHSTDWNGPADDMDKED